ncbi:hypothetical protein KEM48_013763 [Puccinia striiformis f. sp. tritici PST-130]|nr:hypothetical protein KEM48_013763 [Puccinia striiformis f. sp. tritici PST-130]
MLSRITNSRSGSFAATIVWLQSITALLSLLAPVCAGRDHNVLTHWPAENYPKAVRTTYLKQAFGVITIQFLGLTSLIHSLSSTAGTILLTPQLSKCILGQKTMYSPLLPERLNTLPIHNSYVDKAEAQKLSLAYVDENARAIIAVDTTKDISADVMPAVFLNTATGTFKYNRTALRSSVRLESLERYDVGTMVIADFHHTPYGVSSLYTIYHRRMILDAWRGLAKKWRNRYFEGWNDNTHGRATLHTTPNCAHDPTGTQTGKVLQQTCDSSVNWNAGCSVFAAMYTTSEISVWRWRRQDVPDDIKRSNYKEVYFAINSIKIFKGEPDAVSKPVTATAPGPKPVVPPPGLKPGKPVVPTVPKSPSPIPGKELPSSNTKPGGAAGPPPKDHS